MDGLITLNMGENFDTTRVSYKRTRRGKIRKLVRPIYFRDDIPCGVMGCSACADKDIFTQESLIDINSSILIVDAETAVSQSDFLSGDLCVRNCVLPYTSLDALKQVNRAKCDKLRSCARFFAFPNEFLQATFVAFSDSSVRDFNAVISVAKWYKSHLSVSADRIVLLTNSESKRDLAKSFGVFSQTVWEYCDSVRAEFPHAGESLAQTVSVGESSVIYPPHLSTAELHRGIVEGRFHQGHLRMAIGTCMRGTVGEYEIVGKMDLNRSVDGDLVVVEPHVASTMDVDVDVDVNLGVDFGEVVAENLLMNDTVEGQCGRVVGILKRNSKEYAGTLRVETGDDEGSFREDRMFIPADPRIPFIRVKTKMAGELVGKRIVCVVDSWEVDSRSPSGHWVAVLGVAGDRDTESSVILREHSVIVREFSKEVMNCLPSENFVPSEDEIASNRLDLRSVTVCSIDPPGCKDIDDALSCESLPNGNFRVGVHIADVGFFVAPGSAIDLEAAERCTTVYLVEKRTDMLPSLLTANLCSLREKVDRLTFSVLWEMTPEGVIVDTQFAKAVIRSEAALTYAAAQARIDDLSDTSALTRSIRSLNDLAKINRKARMMRGALELASQEVRFELDAESGDPTEVSMYQSRDTNKLVEEFMVLANQSVAHKILNAFPSTSVLRRHPPPKEAQLELLHDLLVKQGFTDFKYSTNLELAKSLAKIVRLKDPFFNKLVRVMTTRCMNQAQYFCTGDVDPGSFWHYGLAMDLYTHFTSPIRRYADLLVHRELAAALGLCKLPDTLQSRPLIHAQCEVMNMKHKLAQCAGRASADLHIHLFFKKLGAQECDTVVTKLRFTKRGQIALHVLSPKFGVEGVVTLGPEWTLDAEKEIAKNNNEQINVFDHVMVRIEADSTNFRFRTLFAFQRKSAPSDFETQTQNIQMFPNPDQ